MRSGILTLLVLAVGLVLLALAWKQHQHGRFAQLKAELKKPAIIPASVVAQAGGQEPLVLERTHTEDATSPEFSKAILLPGRGMNLFQITAWLPQKGEVQLLASPSLDSATKQFTGTGPDVAGAQSLTLGAAYEAPWAGTLYTGSSANGKAFDIPREQRTLAVPATGHSGGLAKQWAVSC